MGMPIVAAGCGRRGPSGRWAGSSGCAARLGHAEVHGSAAGGEFTHGRQFLRGSSQGGLDRGDLAKPALVPGFFEPVEEVGVDLLQPGHLGRVNPEEGTSDTSVFMRTWGS